MAEIPESSSEYLRRFPTFNGPRLPDTVTVVLARSNRSYSDPTHSKYRPTDASDRSSTSTEDAYSDDFEADLPTSSSVSVDSGSGSSSGGSDSPTFRDDSPDQIDVRGLRLSLDETEDETGSTGGQSTKNVSRDQSLSRHNTFRCPMPKRPRSQADNSENKLIRAVSSKFIARIRICYICGSQIGQNSIELHEKKCLKLWHDRIQKLPPFVKVNRPFQVIPPSIDGTVDISHLNRLAEKSATVAQKAECGRCRTGFALGEIMDHVTYCRGRRRNQQQKINCIVYTLSCHQEKLI